MIDGKNPGSYFTFLKSLMYFKIIFIYLFGCTGPQLRCLGSSIFIAACGIFSYGMRVLSYGMWDLVSWSGVKPGPPTLGAWTLSHWATREVPELPYFSVRKLMSKKAVTCSRSKSFSNRSGTKNLGLQMLRPVLCDSAVQPVMDWGLPPHPHLIHMSKPYCLTWWYLEVRTWGGN